MYGCDCKNSISYTVHVSWPLFALEGAWCLKAFGQWIIGISLFTKTFLGRAKYDQLAQPLWRKLRHKRCTSGLTQLRKVS